MGAKFPRWPFLLGAFSEAGKGAGDLSFPRGPRTPVPVFCAAPRTERPVGPKNFSGSTRSKPPGGHLDPGLH